MLHLDPGETIVLEVRKHWFVFFAYGFSLVLAAILPLVFFGATLLVDPIQSAVNDLHIGSLASFAYMVWLLVLWMAFFVQWTNYYLDVWYITEKRIIDVDQKGIFHREITSLRFDKIQDITVEVRGLLATFLNFGDIRVQTASESSKDFYLRLAAHPERIRQIIFSHHNREAEKVQSVKVLPHELNETKE
jgi:uncharacterized membrane protein YdbT with pleckstrin-like domain